MRIDALRKVSFLLGAGVLAGILAAAAAFPAVAGAGLLTKSSVESFENLPSEIHTPPTPQMSQVYASDGKTLIASLFDENRRDVPLSEVAPIMRKAMVASEDIRFYQHNGVDVKGAGRAGLKKLAGGKIEGASTLTMQYVRLNFAYSAESPEQIVAATERTNVRKIREMRYALEVEKKLTKDEILERYLNIAQFGPKIYGIFAASQVYFGKDPKDLTLAQASLLAGLVKAPSDYDPIDVEKRPLALDRREHVLGQMIKAGDITAAEAEAARKEKLEFTGQAPTEGCVVPNSALQVGFYCDYLMRWWAEQKAFGENESSRLNRLKNGGFQIVTALDMNVQASMRKNINAKIKDDHKKALMLSAVVPSTGHVVAIAANRQYSLDTDGNGPNTNPQKQGQRGTYPRTTNPLMSGGGEIVGYPAGSTFKMFTMVAALEQGIGLNYHIDAQDTYHSRVYKTGPGDRSKCPGTNDWCPRNAGKMAGLHNMWSGFGTSVNTYFVPLEEKVGAEKVVDAAHRLGIEFRAAGDQNMTKPENARGWGAFTLGVSATTPLDLASAYGTLANDGVRCQPTPVLEIRDRAGNKLDAAKPRCSKAVSQDVARAATDAARCPVGDQAQMGGCRGSTAGAVRGIVGHPVAGKTGTTDNEESASLVVTTKHLAIAGIEANPDNPLEGGSSHDRVNAAVAYTLKDALQGKPKVNFGQPARHIAIGKDSGARPKPSSSSGPPGFPRR